jgi:hypothetical protein
MSKEVNVQLSIRHAELPALRISVAKLWTVPTSRSTHELEVVVRNAGLAAAGGVTIALNELPPGCRWIDSRRNVGEIRALETRSVRIPLRMDSASGVVPFNIEVRESTGLYPVSRHIDVPVMPP